jgi:hypothetical protein
MKTNPPGALLTTIALLTIAGPDLPAQNLPLDSHLTFQVQDVSILSGSLYTDRVLKLKVLNQDLVDLVATAYVTNFPQGFPLGARLVLVDYNHFQVEDNVGAVLVPDTSEFLTYTDTYAENNYLFKGKEDTATGVRNHTFYYSSTIQFNNGSTNGITFTIHGASQEKFSLSAEDAFGQRLHQDSLTLNASGQGTNVDGFFTISGKLSSKTVKWYE